MRGGEGNSSKCLAVRGAAGDQVAQASVRRSLRCHTGLYRRVGLLLLHRGLLLQLGVADIPEGQIRRHRHPRLPRLSGGHHAAEGKAQGADNGTESVNEPFANLLAKHDIHREFLSVDGPKRNGRVERRIALVKEGTWAAWLEFPRLFPDVRGRTAFQQGNALLCRVAGGIDMDVGKHQHHFARGRSGQEGPEREAVRQTLAQTAAAVPDPGTPHPGLESQVGR